MAYFCLGVDEQSASSRKSAAKEYEISLALLNKLGELTSTRGGPEEARKARGKDKHLSLKEREWVEEAVKEITKRVGEWEAVGATTLDQLTMDHLPDLDS